MGHLREVKSFTVVLESVERPQVGWAHPAALTKQEANEHKGVAECADPTCIALDNERRGLFCANQVTHGLPELSLNAGSVVVCERTAEGTYTVVGWSMVLPSRAL